MITYPKNIIGICGSIGSGKDTAAEYLVARYHFTRLSFAAVLKDACADIFGWDRDMLEGKTAEERRIRESVDEWWASRLEIKNFSPRYALQYVGTELFRGVLHKDIWVYALENTIQKYDRVVISDVRFPNEINMLRRVDMCGRFIVEKNQNGMNQFKRFYLIINQMKLPRLRSIQSIQTFMNLNGHGLRLNLIM